MLLLRRCEIKYGDRQIPIRSGKFASECDYGLSSIRIAFKLQN